MADLGGIRYPIQTTYDGSGVQNFIADLSFARAAFRQFKDDLAASGKSGREFAATERTIADGARLVQQSLTKQVAGLKAVTNAAKEAAQAQKQILNVAGTLPTTTAQTAKNTDAVNKNLKAATTQASLLNSTILKMLVFREVVRVIQLGVSAFKDFVSQGVAFNAELEKTQLGIAGLVASIATIRDAQGRVLEGAEKFAAAQAEARRQTQLLTQDALRTGFAVKQLSENFETAVGPGLAAGLKLDEIRQLAVRVAQIAPAVSLQQNQLAQEIRSLTTGHIRSQTDRIATIFGITSEDITRAKAAGKLFEFLESKFKGFQSVAEELPNTFNGLIERLKTMIELTSAFASEGLFAELKGAMKDLRDTLFSGGAVNPRVVASLRTIFDAVTEVVAQARLMGRELGFEGAQEAAKGIAAVISVIGGALLAVFKVVTQVIAAFGKLSDLLGLNVKNVKSITTEILQIVVASKLLTGSFGLLGGLVSGVSGSLAGLSPRMDAFAKGADKVVGSFTRIAGAAPLIVLAVQGLAVAFTGGKVSIEELTIAFITNLKRIVTFVDAGVAAINAKWKTLILFDKDQRAQAQATLDAVRVSYAKALEDIEKEQIARLSEGIETGLGAGFKTGEQLAAASAARMKESFRTALSDGIGSALKIIPANSIGGALLSQARGALGGGGNSFTKDKRALNESEKESIRLAEQKNVTLGIEAIHLTEITRLRSQNAEKEKIAIEVAKQQTEELRNQRRNVEADTAARIAKLEQTRSAEEDITAIEAQKAALNKEQEGSLAVIDAKIAASLEAERESKIALQDKVNLRLREAELLRQQTQLIELQNSLNIQDAKNKNLGLDDDEQRLAHLQGELLILQQQRSTQAQNFADQKQLIELQRDAGQINPAEAERELATLEQQRIQNVSNLNAEIAVTNEQITALDKQLNGTVFQGAFDGLRAGAKALPTAFEGAFEIIKGAVNGLASTISQVLIDAFDPNNDTSAKDRFKEFLRGLLIQVTQFFVQLALAKAILGASGSGSGGLSGGIAGIIGQVIGTAAAAQGGIIRSPGHYRRDVGSFASGGSVTPPNWVDRRDTVAAWLQPGEFVMPVSSVRQYGLAMMDSLRRGAIAPAAVHAAAGIGGAHVAAAPPKGRSLAAGGAVAAGIGGVANDQPVPAFLVASNQTMERMLNGGKDAFMRFYRENADQLDAIQRRSKPQTR